MFNRLMVLVIFCFCITFMTSVEASYETITINVTEQSQIKGKIMTIGIWEEKNVLAIEEVSVDDEGWYMHVVEIRDKDDCSIVMARIRWLEKNGKIKFMPKSHKKVVVKYVDC